LYTYGSSKRLHHMNQAKGTMYAVSWIRTSGLPILERRSRILGRADRSLGYQVECADHCTTTAVFFSCLGEPRCFSNIWVDIGKVVGWRR
jgi:hypothetical protein